MAESTPSTPIDACRATRIRILLTLGQGFTRAQVADLMAMSAKWGQEEAYERGLSDGRRAAEDDLTRVALDTIARTVAGPVFTEQRHRAEASRYRARREADTAARHPWRTDHRGGPVPDWDLGPEVAARAERLTAELDRLPRVPNPARVCA
jgi:hypothetical protein